MISASFNLSEFAYAVKDKKYCDVILLADQEALCAWRQSQRCGPHMEVDRYESILKEFVRYLKSGVAIPRFKHEFPEELRFVHEKLQEGKQKPH